MLPDNQTYKFLQMHFHWRGSEHFIDGHRYSAELHLVHQNTQDENKFAVLGFLFEVINSYFILHLLYFKFKFFKFKKKSNEDNKDLDLITEALVQVSKFDTKHELQYNLAKLIPFDLYNYFRYPGSLTTPGCDEKVEWFVVSKPILKISEDQLLAFQDLQDHNGYPV